MPSEPTFTPWTKRENPEVFVGEALTPRVFTRLDFKHCITKIVSYMKLHLCTFRNNYMFHDSLNWITWTNLVFSSSSESTNFFSFSKFQCTSHQPTCVADFGWKVNLVKVWYNRVYKILISLIRFGSGGGGDAARQPLWVRARIEAD